jgi:hypothetical protein
LEIAGPPPFSFHAVGHGEAFTLLTTEPGPDVAPIRI